MRQNTMIGTSGIYSKFVVRVDSVKSSAILIHEVDYRTVFVASILNGLRLVNRMALTFDKALADSTKLRWHKTDWEKLVCILPKIWDPNNTLKHKDL